jgi:hypothetical protein
MIGSIAASLALQAGALPASRDTLLAAVLPPRSAWETAADISQIFLALVLVVLLAAIVASLAALRRAVTELATLLNLSREDVALAARGARRLAEDLQAVSAVARKEVEALAHTLRGANEGLQQLLRRARLRLQRLDALAELAQEEAEDFVVSAAATLRGLRLGASVLRRGLLAARRNGARAGRRLRSRRAAPAEPEREPERPRIRTRSGSTQ